MRERTSGLTARFDAIDAALIDGLQGGFPLCDRPFERIARAHALAEAEVIERLAQLIASGALMRVGPVYGPAADASDAAFDPIDRQLVATTRSGLPLVPEPYEAIGAVLGVPAGDVQARLASLLARGVIRRISAVGQRGS